VETNKDYCMPPEILIRVLVVDDNELLRKGLSVFLDICDDMQMVGEAGDGQEAIDLCRRIKPDVVLMDLSMAGMDGVRATQIICREYPRIGIVVLTNTLDHQLVEAALQAGADRCLLKSGISIDDIAEAIRAAARRASS
jgi:DNA-binding NarL/FixJ family response regulator